MGTLVAVQGLDGGGPEQAHLVGARFEQGLGINSLLDLEGINEKHGY